MILTHLVLFGFIDGAGAVTVNVGHLSFGLKLA
jgi:hypothetical protein